MSATRFLAIVVLFLAAACAREPAAPAFHMTPPAAVDPGKGTAPLQTLPLDPRPSVLQGLPTRRVDVDDPVYGRRKQYEGFRLDEIVDRLTPPGTRLEDTAHLVLVCLDGYRAQLPLGLARAGRGVLATRDLGAGSRTWDDLPPGTAVKTPAPLYLVWEDSAKSIGQKLQWPYGVVAIEVWLADPADRAKPHNTSGNIGKGYALFRDTCFNCHRVNGAGGLVGPELNTPANVTEYWNPVALRRFVLNPASIRAGAKMPTLPNLTANDLESILTYLTSMRDQKLAIAP
jgi:mono/diheme cytochrome c family protein